VLAGHSVGAFVAFEMARQLRAQGRIVSHIVLLDPPSPDLGERLTVDVHGGLVPNASWDGAAFAAHHGARLIGAMMLMYRALHASAGKAVDEATCVALHASLASSGTADGAETPETWCLFFDGVNAAGVASVASDSAKTVMRRAVEVVAHEIALFHAFDALECPAATGEAAAAGVPAVTMIRPSANAEFVQRMLHLPASAELWRALLPKGGLDAPLRVVPATGDHWTCLQGDVSALAAAFTSAMAADANAGSMSQ